MDTLLAEGNESFHVKYSHLPGRTWEVSSKWWLSLLTSVKLFPVAPAGSGSACCDRQHPSCG